MKAFINQHFDSKISICTLRFFCSLVHRQTPLTKPHNPTNLSRTFDPYRFLNQSTDSRNYTLKETKIVHTQLLKTGALHSNVELSNLLLRSYAKASAFVYALNLFDTMPHPDTGSWNLAISCQNQNLRHEGSWRTFCRMHSLGFLPNEFTYGSVLSACTALNSVHRGRLLYSLALRHGFALDGYVRSGMIDLLLKSHSFDEALRVFYDESCGNVVCWNAMISGAAKHNEDDLGLNLFREMCRGFPSPNKFTFPSVFGACAKRERLDLGRGIHGLVIKYGEGEDVFVATAIVDFYAKCGRVDEAAKAFSRMAVRNVVSWTAIITGFVQKGEYRSALRLFKEMVASREEINAYTVTSVLSACANPDMFQEAFQIHCWVCKSGFYSDSSVKNSLINLYSRTGVVELSEQVFGDAKDSMDPSTWAAMVTAVSQNGTFKQTFSLLQRMFRAGLRPDTSCLPSVLSVTDCLGFGKQIHSYALKTGISSNVLVGSSLFTMYSKCGSLTDSHDVFEQIPEKDAVSWASMIAGFAEHGRAYEAVELLREAVSHGVVLDETTLSAVFSACASLTIGKEAHGFFVRRWGNNGGGAVVNMYSRCGDSESARKVFGTMRFKDQSSCSSLVSGYAQNGHVEEATKLFRELLLSDVEVDDSYTLSAVLGAVGESDRSNIGCQLHARIVKSGLESDASVGSSLVTMYSRCGSIDDCRKGFDQIANPDLVSWTAMISSYAHHGNGSAALEVYRLMTESGTRPDSVTFVGVLTACSHSGLVEQGYYHLNSMVNDYGIEPGQRHYACMVDVLGRSGRLKEAERFIRGMPVRPGAMVWGTLLAACKVHGEIEIGRVAGERLMELEADCDGVYVALSNMSADKGEWEDVWKIRREMRGSGVKKQAGWSYVCEAEG